MRGWGIVSLRVVPAPILIAAPILFTTIACAGGSAQTVRYWCDASSLCYFHSMRAVSSLIGIALILMGIVWMLQGLNLAFRVGFMVGNFHWTIYGGILVLIGIAQLVWSNTRPRRKTRQPMS